jgi:hypothetical protein
VLSARAGVVVIDILHRQVDVLAPFDEKCRRASF